MKLFSVLRPLLEIAALVGALIIGLRLVTGLFRRKSQVYRPGGLRQFQLLFWPLLCLGVGLPFLGSFLYAPTLSTFELTLLVALAAVILGFSVPAFLLHLAYYARNQHTTLVFDPKHNQLEVYEGAIRIPFGKSDLVRVEYVTCKSEQLFWSPYAYVRLHLRSGHVLPITSLLLKLPPLVEFLRSAPLERRQRWFCWL
ncbi:hypothetical protein ACFPAF_11010 [Hymenobacter endophyticus]|uniref:PH domain-containing protein n=1 Tax=Hymenobacter endophyticus TaxID=3076335 RepID=A0ABU3THS3_9BACT|nr:hypothetical protein [Hymenobacter endophyticus]MDU0370926.1 hypothetical protein [Hymenobacter endophyticus]